ncbi:D-alanyl-D-alanine carboxypeptidase family protein [Pseudogemmobacter sp. W21_MBD1_M6]|uniref:D-alanyl-D-alanine carboxypeptidase family protein n=1 Tax=Pseudogemmobacter sp. W21_MBD1_M6 TaxID=3240271 RepID=UPI003F9C32A9
MACVWVLTPIAALSAPYAAYVIDARSGEVLYERNAKTRLHPASLTKMMTLYITFEAIKRGEISLDTVVTVSKNAAAQPPSKLGLKAGQKIKLRYLIRAAAVKSANDAASAIGDFLEGSEPAFANRMNRTAKALGMTQTAFKNANGLTRDGHLSTARDMTLLGRHLFYDHPDYYNLFSRRTADAGMAQVNNTNRRFLDAYKGADGIKTGYTNAAGFNLVASAERGNERIIATIFGERSTAMRNAKMAELLDLGFRKAPNNAATRKPNPPTYDATDEGELIASSTAGGIPERAGKTIRLSGVVQKSLRPLARPRKETPEPPTELLLAMKDDIKDALAEAQQSVVVEAAPAPEQKPEPPVVVAEATPAEAVSPILVPKARPDTPKMQPDSIILTSASTTATATPKIRMINLVPVPEEKLEVVTRLSTSGGRHWAISVGRYNSSYEAEKVLLKTALKELETLDGTLRKVVNTNRGYDARFLGMTEDGANMACRRLMARNVECSPIGPS